MTNDREILDYIKTQQEVTIPELQKKFSASYSDIVKIIRKLVEEDVIRLDSGVQYSVLKKSDDEDDDEDDEDDIMKRRAYFEARRMDLFRRIREDLYNDKDDDSDEETEAESLDDPEDEEEDPDDETPLEAYAISHELDEGASVVETNGEYYIIPEELEICGTTIRFKIMVIDDEVYLSDDKLALLSLHEHAPSDDEEIGERIGFIVDRYDIGVVGDELRIKVESAEKAITCMMKLFAAMERIVTLGEENVATCYKSAEKEKAAPAIVDEGEEPLDHNTLTQEEARIADIITETLAGFRIDVKVVAVTMGAAVTRYELAITCNVSVSSVIKREAELAMRLGQKDGVRVYADASSGKICVEVPRIVSEREKIQAEALIRGKNERWNKADSLFFAIGKNIDGEFVYGDIARFKHILIGGSCCSGKSTLLHTMIYSFITKYSPDEVRLILCDAKKTEFAPYRGMPHLLTGQIVTEAEQMVSALRWANKEMERRYQLFERKTAAGDTVRNIDEYNAVREGDETKLPRIVVIVDEYEDFISVAKREIEETVQRLAQKARAAGIHLVLSTQQPTADIVTGALKSNLPTRIAFRVIQEIDSRAILDENGAEKLLGLGDLLMRSESDFQCERIQSAYVPHEALIAAVAETKKMYEAEFDEEAKKSIKRTSKKAASNASNKDLEAYPDNPLYIKALAIVIQEGTASISLVQRKCRIGYNHAGKIIEWMERMGYISPFDRSKGRQILITKKQFVKKYGPLD